MGEAHELPGWERSKTYSQLEHDRGSLHSGMAALLS